MSTVTIITNLILERDDALRERDAERARTKKLIATIRELIDTRQRELDNGEAIL